MNHLLRTRLAAASAVTGQLAAAALALVLGVACNGGGDAPAPPDLTVLPPDLYGLDFKDWDYPRGPYAQSGNVNPGDTFPDFTFQGYWSPTATTGSAAAQPYREVTFGMLHDSGKRYAIIQLAAFW